MIWHIYCKLFEDISVHFVSPVPSGGTNREHAQRAHEKRVDQHDEVHLVVHSCSHFRPLFLVVLHVDFADLVRHAVLGHHRASDFRRLWEEASKHTKPAQQEKHTKNRRTNGRSAKATAYIYIYHFGRLIMLLRRNQLQELPAVRTKLAQRCTEALFRKFSTSNTLIPGLTERLCACVRCERPNLKTDSQNTK